MKGCRGQSNSPIMAQSARNKFLLALGELIDIFPGANCSMSTWGESDIALAMFEPSTSSHNSLVEKVRLLVGPHTDKRRLLSGRSSVLTLLSSFPYNRLLLLITISRNIITVPIMW